MDSLLPLHTPHKYEVNLEEGFLSWMLFEALMLPRAVNERKSFTCLRPSLLRSTYDSCFSKTHLLFLFDIFDLSQIKSIKFFFYVNISDKSVKQSWSDEFV